MAKRFIIKERTTKLNAVEYPIDALDIHLIIENMGRFSLYGDEERRRDRLLKRLREMISDE